MLGNFMTMGLTTSTPTASADMTAITTGAGEMLTLMGTVVTTITGNPILAAILAVGFVGLAIGLFKKIKRGAK